MIKEGTLLGGRYEVMNRIGNGGMANVYKAIDRVLNRYVAVKVLKSEFREDETFVKKFRSEAQAAAGLLHPNIVQVYDVAEDRGLYYIVMELVEGITLKDYIQKKGRLTPKEVVGITVQVCAGIDVAHAHNIIHRDIKPQNIIISKEGKVKVTDFGIAKATSSNTISTNAMGSVHYTSPEQARGGFSDAKSDVYSLGITMYEMITGRLPFDGDSTVSIALKHLQEDIVAPSEYVPDIPYSLESIILKCTQKSPDRRYADVGQLIRDLKRSLTEPDGDFVKIMPFVSVADTVMITPEELETIQNSRTEYSVNGDDYSDDYDDEEEERREKRMRKGKTSEIDPKMAKIMKVMTIIVVIIFAFILIFAAGNAAGLFKFGPGIVPEVQKNVVPELVGKTFEEAEKACNDAGYKINAEYAESEQYEEGYVIEQKTDAGVELPSGTVITVVVSSGLKGKEIQVPDVYNMVQDNAIDVLVKAGFLEENITVVTKEDNFVKKGKVISVTPEIGSMTTENAMITVIVSEGASQQMVPYMVGKTKDEAVKALEELELVAEIEEIFSEKPAGQVLEQGTEYGTFVDAGTKVKLIVSKGPEPVQMATIPTGLAGKTVNSVVAAIRNAGLVEELKYSDSTEYETSIVISVSGEGTEVPVGSTVVVTVSTGPGPSTETPTEPEEGTDVTE